MPGSATDKRCVCDIGHLLTGRQTNIQTDIHAVTHQHVGGERGTVTAKTVDCMTHLTDMTFNEERLLGSVVLG